MPTIASSAAIYLAPFVPTTSYSPPTASMAALLPFAPSPPRRSPAPVESRLVIKERDDVLAENVLKACREHPGRPVVAVLGLLHCNGVADILRNSEGFKSVVGAGGGD